MFHQSCISLRWTKFFYMLCVPSHSDLDWPRLEPSPADFVDAMKTGGRVVLEEDTQKGKVFTVPKSMTLPKALNFTVSNLQKVDRSAGTAANQRAAAATAWILSNAASGFIHGPMAWTGEMLPKVNKECRNLS